MADVRKEKAVATANRYQQGNIAGLDDAMTRRLIASTVLTESNGGDLSITNAQGYVGRYQAGAGWLVDAGFVDGMKYKAAMTGYKSEWDWANSGNKDKMDKFLADPANWKDGLNLENYKQSADMQDKAFKINSDSAYHRAIKNGVLHESDSTEHVAGFLKARHISGYAGAKAAVTGGAKRKDGNGTSNYDYYNDIALNRDGLDQLMSRDPKRQSQVPTQDVPQSISQSRRPDADGIYRQGEKGDDIRGLQTTLNLLGYRDANGNILKEDGDFGKHTKAAVEAFQKNNGLTVDGIVGRDTLESLGKQSPGQWKVTAPGQEVQTIAPLSKPEQAVLLSNPSHPDHALYQQALARIGKLPPNSFKDEHERQNAAATVAFEAKVSGLKQIDHVVLNTTNTGLFAVEGRMDDPAHHRLYVDKAQAAAQPIEKSTQQMQQETQQQPYQQQQPQPQQIREPRLSM